MAAGLAAITPFDIIGYLYYPLLLGVMAALGIVFNFQPRTLRGVKGEKR